MIDRAQAKATQRRTVALLAGAMAVAAGACGPVVGQPVVFVDGGASTLALGLVGYWKLDETGADEPVVDSSGQGNTGTPIDQPLPSGAGAPVRIANAGSRSFDGGSQLVDLGNPAALNFAGDVTLAAWVYLTAMPANCAVVLAHGYRHNPNAELALRASGDVPCEVDNGPARWSAGIWDDGGNHMAETPLLASDINVWIHIAGTFDGNAWHLYKNGSEMSVLVHDVGAFPFDAPWGIGGRSTVSPPDPRSWPGRLDEVRIYNRALSPSEILALYHL
jgi:hypothetical protein